MATIREKQLAALILKERIEHSTGKKVVLVEDTNTIVIDGVTITKDENNKIYYYFPQGMSKEKARHWKNKNALEIAKFKDKEIEKKEEKFSQSLKEAIIKEIGIEGFIILQENWLGTSDLDKSLIWFNKIRTNQALYNKLKATSPEKAKALMDGLTLWRKWYDPTNKEKKLGEKPDPNEPTKIIKMSSQEIAAQKAEKEKDMKQFVSLINPLRQMWNKSVGLVTGGL